MRLFVSGLMFLFLLSGYTPVLKNDIKDDAPNKDTLLFQHQLYILTGSDWCPNCNRFDKKVLRDSNFINGLKSQKVELVLLDFPQRKKLSEQESKMNDSLAISLNFDGNFPGIILKRISDGQQSGITYQNENAIDFKNVLIQHLSKLP